MATGVNANLVTVLTVKAGEVATLVSWMSTADIATLKANIGGTDYQILESSSKTHTPARYNDGHFPPVIIAGPATLKVTTASASTVVATFKISPNFAE